MAGENWGEAIIDAITESKVMVIIFSENANTSQQVMREVERAVFKNIPIIPLRIQDVVPTKSMEYFLSTPHWLDALDDDTEKHISELLETVDRILKQNPTETEALVTDRGSLHPLVDQIQTRRKGKWLRKSTIAFILLFAMITTSIITVILFNSLGGKSSETIEPELPLVTDEQIGKVTQSGFRDDFKNGLDDEWQWIREDENNWQINPEGLLRIRTQPGEIWATPSMIETNNLRNLLVRPTPEEEHINKLILLSKTIEDIMGYPQDIEWVLVNDEFKILQSRNITTLYPIEPEYLYDDQLRLYMCYNTTIQGMTAPYTPLAFEFWRCSFAAYTSIYYGGKKKDLHPFWIKYINGRIHYDLTEILGKRILSKNALSMLDAKDPSGGLLMKDIFSEYKSLFFKQGGSFKLKLNIIRFLLKLSRYGKISKTDYNAALIEVYDLDKSFEQELDENIKKVNNLSNATKLIEETVEAFSFLAFKEVMYINYGLQSFAKWEKWFKKHHQDVDLMPIQFAVEHNPTTEMSLAIMTTALSYIEDETKPAINDKRIRLLLEKYGHRGEFDTDIGKPRWYETPIQILNMVEMYMENNLAKESINKFEKQREEAITLIHELHIMLKDQYGYKKAQKFKFDMENYRYLSGLREFPKFTMVKYLAKLRNMMLDLGQYLVDNNQLLNKEDVAYLYFSELETKDPIDLKSIVKTRKADFKKQSSYKEVPRFILSNGETYYQPPTVSDHNAIITGVPLSSGIVRGRVKILDSPDIGQIKSDEILVTHNTDPSWTPLFPVIKGLVMEAGGPISHGAIVAREFGLPSIGGVANARQQLIDGMLIEMDGRNGTIEIIRSEDTQ